MKDGLIFYLQNQIFLKKFIIQENEFIVLLITLGGLNEKLISRYQTVKKSYQKVINRLNLVFYKCDYILYVFII